MRQKQDDVSHQKGEKTKTKKQFTEKEPFQSAKSDATEVCTAMRDKHVDNPMQAFFSKPPCPQASVACRMQSENRAKEIPMCDFIVNGG